PFPTLFRSHRCRSTGPTPDVQGEHSSEMLKTPQTGSQQADFPALSLLLVREHREGAHLQLRAQLIDESDSFAPPGIYLKALRFLAVYSILQTDAVAL